MSRSEDLLCEVVAAARARLGGADRPRPDRKCAFLVVFHGLSCEEHESYDDAVNAARDTDEKAMIIFADRGGPVAVEDYT